MNKYSDKWNRTSRHTMTGGGGGMPTLGTVVRDGFLEDPPGSEVDSVLPPPTPSQRSGRGIHTTALSD